MYLEKKYRFAIRGNSIKVRTSIDLTDFLSAYKKIQHYIYEHRHINIPSEPSHNYQPTSLLHAPVLYQHIPVITQANF